MQILFESKYLDYHKLSKNLVLLIKNEGSDKKRWGERETKNKKIVWIKSVSHWKNQWCLIFYCLRAYVEMPIL